VRPSHAKLSLITNEDMVQAVRQGTARQRSAELYHHKPHGEGSVSSHSQGRLGEIAFCRYLGVPVPAWTYEEDKKRGCDVVGPDGTRYHIRSSSYPRSGLMIKPSDPRGGVYVLVITTANGNCKIMGWYTRGEAEMYHELGTMIKHPDVKCWTIPQEDLYPFAATGYAVAA
jgi:hypothetical protein